MGWLLPLQFDVLSRVGVRLWLDGVGFGGISTCTLTVGSGVGRGILRVVGKVWFAVMYKASPWLSKSVEL